MDGRESIDQESVKVAPLLRVKERPAQPNKLRLLILVRQHPGGSELEYARMMFGLKAVQPRVNAISRELEAGGLIRRDYSTRPLCLYPT